MQRWNQNLETSNVVAKFFKEELKYFVRKVNFGHTLIMPNLKEISKSLNGQEEFFKLR